VSLDLPRDDRLAPLSGPLVVAVMDGIGWGPRDGGDAVHLAATPHLDRIWSTSPTRTLAAHGRAVGLPSDADMGNSEVGHNALGAGRVVRQGAALVNDAIASGAIFESSTWSELAGPLVGCAQRTLHLCGLLSDGNVHSHIDHVFALIDGASRSGVSRVRIHPLADGRDVADPSYETYLAALDRHLDGHRAAGRDYAIASGGGRMVVTMDRYEADWSIVERGWKAHVLGDAPAFSSWHHAVETLRKEPGGGSDQTLGPFCIADASGPIGRVQDDDAFVFWNFRGDRAIELTRAFEDDAFDGFDRQRRPNVRFAGMMQYDGDLHLPSRYLVAPPTIDRTMGEFAARLGIRTLATSETQKFGHVTYFWNGNRSGTLDDSLETYVEIPSDRIAFNHAPLMKAAAITDVVAAALAGPRPPGIVRLNYANGDMVGHTGDLAATITAVQAVDTEIGRLLQLVQAHRGVLVVTADHGNADDMWMRAKDGTPKLGPGGSRLARTSHTLAPVPLTIVDTRSGPRSWQLRADLPHAGLSNVAATLFALKGYRAPEGYDAALIAPR